MSTIEIDELNILWIDDEPRNCAKIIHKIESKYSVIFTQSSTTKTAMRYLEKHAFDGIICDLCLPSENPLERESIHVGANFIADLKSGDIGKKIANSTVEQLPILILTALSAKADILINLLQQRSIDYTNKPVSFDYLQQWLQNHVMEYKAGVKIDNISE